MKVKDLCRVLGGGGRLYKLDLYLYYNGRRLEAPISEYMDDEVLFMRDFCIKAEEYYVENKNVKARNYILQLDVVIR